MLTLTARGHARVVCLVTLCVLLGLGACNSGAPTSTNSSTPSNDNTAAVMLVDDDVYLPLIDLGENHEFRRITFVAHSNAENSGTYTLRIRKDSSTGPVIWGPVVFTARSADSEERTSLEVPNIRYLSVHLHYEDAPDRLTPVKADSPKNVPKKAMFSVVRFEGPPTRGIFTTPIGLTIVATK